MLFWGKEEKIDIYFFTLFSNGSIEFSISAILFLISQELFFVLCFIFNSVLMLFYKCNIILNLSEGFSSVSYFFSLLCFSWCVSIITGLVTCSNSFIIKHELLESRVGILLIQVWGYCLMVVLGRLAGSWLQCRETFKCQSMEVFSLKPFSFPDKKPHNSCLEEKACLGA